MKKRNVLSNSVTFNLIIKAWGKEGNVKKANQLFQRMKYLCKTGLNTATKPDLVTYNSIVNIIGMNSQEHDSPEIFIKFFKSMMK